MTILEFQRRQLGLTLHDLATDKRVRIAAHFLSLLENERGVPTEDQRVRLARRLGVHANDLLKRVVLDRDATAKLVAVDE